LILTYTYYKEYVIFVLPFCVILFQQGEKMLPLSTIVIAMLSGLGYALFFTDIIDCVYYRTSWSHSFLMWVERCDFKTAEKSRKEMLKIIKERFWVVFPLALAQPLIINFFIGSNTGHLRAQIIALLSVICVWIPALKITCYAVAINRSPGIYVEYFWAIWMFAGFFFCTYYGRMML
jgi:hypothetical protein